MSTKKRQGFALLICHKKAAGVVRSSLVTKKRQGFALLICHKSRQGFVLLIFVYGGEVILYIMLFVLADSSQLLYNNDNFA